MAKYFKEYKGNLERRSHGDPENLTEIAVTTILQNIYFKGMINNFENADEILQGCLFSAFAILETSGKIGSRR